MKHIDIEGMLKLVKNKHMDNWYTIERAEHDNKHWMEDMGDYGALRYSGRISDACVEGPAHEMLGIARGIYDGNGYGAKRCAVVAICGDFAFWSPRNSQKAGIVSAEAAYDLAEQIIKLLETTTDKKHEGA